MIRHAAGLFPRRFLFATFRFQPERAAEEAGGIEIAVRATFVLTPRLSLLRQVAILNYVNPF